MLRHVSCTIALAFAAALMCQPAFASTPSEGTQTANATVQKVAPTKRSRLLYLSLPDSVIHAFKYPVQKIRSWFSHDRAKPAVDADENGYAAKGSSPYPQALSPDSDAHRRTSMYIGLTQPNTSTNPPSPYLHDTTIADASGCGTAAPAHGASADSQEGEIKGTLLNGLSVGLCMRF